MNIENGINTQIEMLSETLKHVNEHFSALRKQTGDAAEHAATSVGSMTARVGRAIKLHPIAAIGIAFGVGYFAMRLFRR